MNDDLIKRVVELLNRFSKKNIYYKSENVYQDIINIFSYNENICENYLNNLIRFEARLRRKYTSKIGSIGYWREKVGAGKIMSIKYKEIYSEKLRRITYEIQYIKINDENDDNKETLKRYD